MEGVRDKKTGLTRFCVLKSVVDEGILHGASLWFFRSRKAAEAFVWRDYDRVVKENDLDEDWCNVVIGKGGKLSYACAETEDGRFQVDWRVDRRTIRAG